MTVELGRRGREGSGGTRAATSSDQRLQQGNLFGVTKVCFGVTSGRTRFLSSGKQFLEDAFASNPSLKVQIEFLKFRAALESSSPRGVTYNLFWHKITKLKPQSYFPPRGRGVSNSRLKYFRKVSDFVHRCCQSWSS
jgi:hypothetical protein